MSVFLRRIVHAKGTGVYGTFTLTKDLSDYTIADHFNGVGKQTGKPSFVSRPSVVKWVQPMLSVIHAVLGYVSIRLAVIHDIVGNNTPTFFLRDGIKFPDFIHTQKRNPQTNLKYPQAMGLFFFGHWTLKPCIKWPFWCRIAVFRPTTVKCTVMVHTLSRCGMPRASVSGWSSTLNPSKAWSTTNEQTDKLKGIESIHHSAIWWWRLPMVISALDC